MLSTNLLASLLLAHLLADFPLQTGTIIHLKNRTWCGILLHVAIHLVVTSLLLKPVTHSKSSYLLILAVIGISHYFIDWIKVASGSRLPALRMFIIDQYLHLLSLLAAIGICLVLGLDLPVSQVPQVWLLRSLSLAFCLALMVMGWLWLNETENKTIRHHRLCVWSRAKLLRIEQYIGMVLVTYLLFLVFFR